MRKLGRRNVIWIVILTGAAVYWTGTSGVDEYKRLTGTAHVPCDIKGNINIDGEHIYHVPGGYYYDATRINRSREERWFCSRWDALKAGWRPSVR